MPFQEPVNMLPLNVQRKIANPGSRGPHLLQAPVSKEFKQLRRRRQ